MTQGQMDRNTQAADARPEQRPGVPMEREPRAVEGAHWAEPERQPEDKRLTRRAELRQLTPVFGTAQPPRGVAGLIRRLAYQIPEHHSRHWMLLLGADRVEVLLRRVRKAVTIGLSLAALGAFVRAQRA